MERRFGNTPAPPPVFFPLQVAPQPRREASVCIWTMRSSAGGEISCLLCKCTTGVAPESSGTSLRIAPPGPGRLRSGCLPPELEPVDLLRTPTGGATSPHSTETAGRRGYSATDSPQLARTGLVRTDPVDADGCALSASPGG